MSQSDALQRLNSARLFTLGGQQAAAKWCKNLEGDFSAILMHLDAALAALSATGAPSHLPLANAIAAMKPEWGIGEESKTAWKQFVEGFQSGRLVVSENVSHSPTDKLERTPRTDAFYEVDEVGQPRYASPKESFAFARQLERELAEFAAVRDELLLVIDRLNKEKRSAVSATAPQPVAWRCKREGIWVYFEEFPRYEESYAEPLYVASDSTAKKEGQ